MRVLLFAALMAGLSSPSAFAAPDPAELQCGAKFSAPADIQKCLSDALEQAELKLAQAQDQLKLALQEARPQLRNLHTRTLEAVESMMNKAQDAWRDFRENRCEYLRDLHGALGEDAMEYTACGLKMVRERTRELVEEARFWSDKLPAASQP